MNEIKKLLESGVLGFYNSIEVTEIFAILPDKSIANVFTIMVAEHRDKAEYDKGSYLTKNLLTIPGLKKWRFGIKRYIKKKKDIIPILENLSEKGTLANVKNLKPLIYCPKRFVAPNSFEEVPLNKILKNNFHNGSYVIEWFDHEKESIYQLLETPALLQELSSKIQDYVPIAIAALSDRLGNFLLQIPSAVLQARFTSAQKDNGLKCNIVWHPDAERRDLLVNCSLDEHDKLLEGYASKRLNKNNDNVDFDLGYQKAHIGIVWDEENEVLLSATRPSSFIRTIQVSSNIMHSENRILTPANGETARVSLSVNNSLKVGLEVSHKKDWTTLRIYKDDKLQLHKRKEFVQYNPKGKEKKQERERALTDIRELIIKHGQKGVWLWDPYLSDKDIFDTLFYNPVMHAEMRAITDLKEPPKIKKEVLCSKCSETVTSEPKMPLREVYKNSFTSLNEEALLGIKLEFRARDGKNGWSFHDRFLLFPYADPEAMVWSLGISVNSLGKDHHILQKVSDAQLIVDAFSELWEQLTPLECLIWSRHEN
jgi:hypothetical protein